MVTLVPRTRAASSAFAGGGRDRLQNADDRYIEADADGMQPSVHRIVGDDCKVATRGLQSKQSPGSRVECGPPCFGPRLQCRGLMLPGFNEPMGGVGSGNSLPCSRKCSFAHLQSSRRSPASTARQRLQQCRSSAAATSPPGTALRGLSRRASTKPSSPFDRSRAEVGTSGKEQGDRCSPRCRSDVAHRVFRDRHGRQLFALHHPARQHPSSWA